MFVVRAQYITASTLLGSKDILSFVTTWPRKFTFSSQNSQLENFTYNFFFLRFCSTFFRCCLCSVSFLNIQVCHRWKQGQTCPNMAWKLNSLIPWMLREGLLIQIASQRIRSDHILCWDLRKVKIRLEKKILISYLEIQAQDLYSNKLDEISNKLD